MNNEMWCFHCAESVYPRTKWVCDAVQWLCPKCGKTIGVVMDEWEECEEECDE